MNQLAPLPSRNLALVPALIAAAGDRACSAFWNSSRPTSATRTRGGPTPRRGRLSGLVRRMPGAVDHGRAAASRRRLDRAADAEHAAPTVKQRLAAIRHLFDWLVTGQVVPPNPAASVRGPATSS